MVFGAGGTSCGKAAMGARRHRARQVAGGRVCIAGAMGNVPSVPGLEMDAQAELHVARSVGLARDAAEGGRAAEIERRAAHHDVIHHIGEQEAEGGADAALLPDADVFGEAGVNVPAREAAEIGVAAAACVDAESAGAELGEDRGWVSEHVHSGRIVGADSVRGLNVVKGGSASRVRGRTDDVLGGRAE